MLADSHVHLHAYDDAEVAGMVRRAAAAGVTRIVAVSVDLPSAERTIAIARRHDGVVAAIGFHPAGLPAMPDEAVWARFDALADDPTVRAIGECGVHAGGPAGPAVQLKALERQARIAASHGMPLLLHLVADDRLIDEALAVVRGQAAVAHYFRGDVALATRYLDAGLHISLGKPVTRTENGALRAAVGGIPLDRLLLETDTYPMPDRATEPADTRLVAEAVAELRAVDLVAVAEATSANLKRLLGR